MRRAHHPGLAVAALVLAAACSKSPCERAVHRVIEVTSHAGPPGSEPHADEQRAIDMVETMTVGVCEREGLDDAQLACILAIKTMSDLETVSACPAIASKHPSWLISGPLPSSSPPP